jgi:hypothetical protein
MRGLKFLSLFIALAMMLGTTSMAMAATPISFSFDDAQTDTIDCGAFDVSDSWTSHTDARAYFDNQGNWIRTGALFSYVDHWTGPDGKEATSAHGEKVYVVERPGGDTHTGIDYNVVVPGVGNLLINAGYFNINDATGEVILHGNHQVDDGDLGKLCAYLAPG